MVTRYYTDWKERLQGRGIQAAVALHCAVAKAACTTTGANAMFVVAWKASLQAPACVMQRSVQNQHI